MQEPAHEKVPPTAMTPLRNLPIEKEATLVIEEVVNHITTEEKVKGHKAIDWKEIRKDLCEISINIAATLLFVFLIYIFIYTARLYSPQAFTKHLIGISAIILIALLFTIWLRRPYIEAKKEINDAKNVSKGSLNRENDIIFSALVSRKYSLKSLHAAHAMMESESRNLDYVKKPVVSIMSDFFLSGSIIALLIASRPDDADTFNTLLGVLLGLFIVRIFLEMYSFNWGVRRKTLTYIQLAIKLKSLS